MLSKLLFVYSKFKFANIDLFCFVFFLLKKENYLQKIHFEQLELQQELFQLARLQVRAINWQYKREELSAIVTFVIVVVVLVEIVAKVEVVVAVVKSSVGFEELALVVGGIVGI